LAILFVHAIGFGRKGMAGSTRRARCILPTLYDCSTLVDRHTENGYDKESFLGGSISGQDSPDQFAGCY